MKAVTYEIHRKMRGEGWRRVACEMHLRSVPAALKVEKKAHAPLIKLGWKPIFRVVKVTREIVSLALALVLLFAACGPAGSTTDAGDRPPIVHDLAPGEAAPPYDPNHVCTDGDVIVGCFALDGGGWDHDPNGPPHCYCAVDPRSTG